MLDRTAFMETLRSVAEIRKTSAEPLSKEEILKYFDDMELTEEQTELIYQYMLLPPELQTAEPEQGEEEQQPIPEDTQEEENPYFRMYLDDLAAIEELTEEELSAAYQKLLDGDTSVIGVICESWLQSIAGMAISYAEQGANLEDVIQEGSMGLLIKLSELAGAKNVPDIVGILEEAAATAMAAYTEETMEGQVADMLVKEQGKKVND